MVIELIKKMFLSRDEAHLNHWKTKSYAQHEALGEYYEGVIDLLDKYVEAHQGAFGIVETETANIAKKLNADIIWITENRATISQGVPALENILDELVGLKLKTLYKLENLR